MLNFHVFADFEKNRAPGSHVLFHANIFFQNFCNFDDNVTERFEAIVSRTSESNSMLVPGTLYNYLEKSQNQ